MAAPSQNVFQYAFAAPFPISLSNGTIFAYVSSGVMFEFERDAGDDPHWYIAYELVNGVRGGKLFRVAFEDNGAGGLVPTA